MKKYWTFIGLLLLFFLILFLIVEQLNVPILTAPRYLMHARSVGAASVGITLLIADVFLPVSCSLVMITNGAVFGVILGTLLSLVGSLGAGLVEFFIGKRGGSLLARLVPPEELLQADRLLEKWGNLAIIVTRQVPCILINSLNFTVNQAKCSRAFWVKVTVINCFLGTVIIFK
jgi:uncharacterized membrane protein YdjX (TVP38/TMEM64 family)